MPKQKGTHRLLGTTGDMTYQKTKDGYTAREKAHISPERIKNSESYARVRENMAEFARAGKASKTFRTALMAVLKAGSDTRMTSRLTTEMLRIIKSDPVSDRGQRSLLLGELDTLSGFEFNSESELAQGFRTPYQISFNRQTGQSTISIPAFSVREALSVPEGATHCRIVSGIASVDFERSTHYSDFKNSVDLALNDDSLAAVTLTPQIPGSATTPVFLVLGITFFIATNAKMYPVNRSFNQLRLVLADVGA